MKEKVKRFFIDKKELLIFITVVVVVFATVITIASLALSDTPVSTQPPVVDDNPPVSKPDDDGGNKEEPVIPDPIKFSVPVLGEYVIVRTYYDLALSDEELVSAIIVSGNSMLESKGLSYAKPNNAEFDVHSIYDGVVVSVVEDELNGTTVTIKHSDNVISIYSSLADVSLKQNDTVTVGQVIGSAAASLLDVEAGVHVHLEIKVGNSYVNPTTVFGKELTEVSSGK